MDSFTAGFAIFGLAVVATGIGLLLRPHSSGLRSVGTGLLVLLGGVAGLWAPGIAMYLFVLQGVFPSSALAVWVWYGLPGAAAGVLCGTQAARIFFRRSVSMPERSARTYFQAALALTLLPLAFWVLVIYVASVRNR